MHPFARTLAALTLAASTAAFAQGYPNAPVTMVVPFAAGSGTDAVARVIAKQLGERLKQPVLVDQRVPHHADLFLRRLFSIQKLGVLGVLAVQNPALKRCREAGRGRRLAA